MGKRYLHTLLLFLGLLGVTSIALSFTTYPLTRILTGPLARSLAKGNVPILAYPGSSVWLASDLNGDLQTIDNAGKSGAGVATFGSTADADSNDPTYLPWATAGSDNDIQPDYLDDSGQAWYFAGPNLVSNGTFDDATGWTIEDVWTIEDGVAKGSGANGTSEELLTTSTIPTDMSLYISYDINNYSSGSVDGRTIAAGGVSRSSNGTFEEVQSLPAAYFKFRGVSFNGSIDNVVVRQVFRGPSVGYRYVGDELVTNGTFDTDITGWTDLGTTTLSWQSGTLQSVGTGAFSGPTQDITCSIGSTYIISAELVSSTANEIFIRAGSAGVDLDYSIPVTPGTFEATFVATATSEEIYLRAATGTTIWDNVSVREVTPYGAPIYTYLDGTGYISQADEAGNSPLGSFTAEVYVALDDYANGSLQVLMAKYDGGTGNRAWYVGIDATGGIKAVLSSTGAYDGANDRGCSDTSVLGIDGERLGVQFRYDAPNSTGSWWIDSGSGWVQKGADRTEYTLTSIYDSDADLIFGSLTGGGSPATGKFYSGKLYSGVGSGKTLVSSWDASLMSEAGGPDGNSSNWDVEDSGTYYAYASDELVTNGDFSNWTDDDPDNWTPSAEDATNYVTEVSGALRFVNDGSFWQVTADGATLVPNNYYKILGTSVANTTGSVQIGGFTPTVTLGLPGTIDAVYFNNTATAVSWKRSSGATDVTIDDISVRQVAPVSQNDWTITNGVIGVPSGDYVYLPGSASNYISSTNPDETGDQTWTWWGSLDDYASGVGQVMFSVYETTANQKSYMWRIATTGELQVYISTDGSASTVKTTAAVIPATNGEWIGIQVRYTQSAGTAEVLYSLDGQNWTSQETLTALPTSMFSSSAVLTVGAYNDGGASFMTGKVGWATIHSNASYTGDPVWKWDASQSQQSGYTDPYSGEANTINRSATGLKSTLVTRPVLVLDSAASTYLEIADHVDLDMESGDRFTAFVYGRQHATPPSSGKLLDKRDATSGWLLQNNSTNLYLDGFVDEGATTTTTGATTPVYVGGESELFGLIRTDTGISYSLNSGISAETTPQLGDLSNTGSLNIGRRYSGGNYAELEVWAWGVIKGTALTSQQLATLKNELDVELGGRIGEGFLIFLIIPFGFRRRWLALAVLIFIPFVGYSQPVRELGPRPRTTERLQDVDPTGKTPEELREARRAAFKVRATQVARKAHRDRVEEDLVEQKTREDNHYPGRPGGRRVRLVWADAATCEMWRTRFNGHPRIADGYAMTIGHPAFEFPGDDVTPGSGRAFTEIQANERVQAFYTGNGVTLCNPGTFDPLTTEEVTP